MRNVQDAVKKMSVHIDTAADRPMVSANLRERLSSTQQHALLHNSALFAALASQPSASSKKGAGASDYVTHACALAEASPDSQAAALLAALTTARCKSTDAGVQRLTDWAAAHADQGALQPLLLAAHLALTGQAPQVDRALQLLSSELLPEQDRNAPALVMSRVALLERQGAQTGDAARAELERALAWWEARAEGADRTRALCSCLEQLSGMHLRQGDAAAAKEALQRLAVRPSSLLSLARLPF